MKCNECGAEFEDGDDSAALEHLIDQHFSLVEGTLKDIIEENFE